MVPAVAPPAAAVPEPAVAPPVSPAPQTPGGGGGGNRKFTKAPIRGATFACVAALPRAQHMRAGDWQTKGYRKISKNDGNAPVLI
ncbi:hypothetical protein NEUTE1DRAFT_140355 [Neurospora tetrasperma FGSC 2508]|uniref:Uncharacterized protein n=1 Tax=Neurospora tetrasperma (strain FGSC 2508 / ATCC MYA-4615 / P0657) TaxID=510951 RepID=F8MVV8_NEUT8|nr:uncharacterized protein NEUTE1DRAFT_140355 [Neurospora tetrasperma FGSC 2508]EGO54006.1 hypothetical protein NEUTE1DRAFT_140355 [Neurospora tetrasperma FGSC 2508]EGZ68573.1 hypothetical protein NEUTE2DRAFT_170288 [Neurospora tetrasperma FGSC 2509]